MTTEGFGKQLGLEVLSSVSFRERGFPFTSDADSEKELVAGLCKLILFYLQPKLQDLPFHMLPSM